MNVLVSQCVLPLLVRQLCSLSGVGSRVAAGQGRDIGFGGKLNMLVYGATLCMERVKSS